jgi:hypothetical protein
MRIIVLINLKKANYHGSFGADDIEELLCFYKVFLVSVGKLMLIFVFWKNFLGVFSICSSTET